MKYSPLLKPHHAVRRRLLTVALAGLTTVQPVLEAASSLPTGGAFTAGTGNITAAGNAVTINQSSFRGIIDWNTFSLGKGGFVAFNNGSGVTLNRVTGNTPSSVLGQLLASGSVYLLNPQRVLIGKSATVHTGGDFLVSTLNFSNQSFLSGASLLFTGSSPATVINMGDLTSTGGNIYLIGHTVQNGGSITNLSIANGNGLATGPGYNITLVDGGAFTNSDGANALNVSGGGQWQVYSQDPANDIAGGLTPAFKQYNATYGVTAPAQAGDGLLYTLAPTIAATLGGTASKTYDGTTAATIATANVTNSGAIQGDTVSVSFGSAAYGDPNANTGIDVTASNFTITASNGNIPVYGYQISSPSASANIGVITPATLTYAATPASQTYGSNNTSFTGTIAGFVNNQNLASATTGTALFSSLTNTASPAGLYAINGSGLTANRGNYTFVQAASNASALTITVAPTPTPTPTPSPTTATISININSLIGLTGQTPAFSAAYNGSPSNGLDIASLLAGLTYQITPAFHGPGLYTVTASGVAPAGYVLNILPGTFTLLDSSPVTLPTQAQLIPVLVPSLFDAYPLLAPVNSSGFFEIYAISNDNGFDSQEKPLTQSSFFNSPNAKPTTYAAGAKP